MASVISDWQSRNRPVWLNSVNDHDSLVWRAAGVGSGSAAFYFVHCRCHDALRTYIECDWNTEFAAVNLELEEMWNIIKNKIDDGVKRFVPLTSRLNNTNGNTIKW